MKKKFTHNRWKDGQMDGRWTNGRRRTKTDHNSLWLRRAKNRLKSMVHHRKYPTFTFDLYLGVKFESRSDEILSRYLYIMNDALVKFEVATSNGLGVNAVTSKDII